jgi:hypothetical protein
MEISFKNTIDSLSFISKWRVASGKEHITTITTGKIEFLRSFKN